MPDTDLKNQIKDSLADFAKKPLYEAGIGFLDILGYRSERVLKVESISDFQKNFDPKGFLCDSNAFIKNWKTINFLFQLTDSELTDEDGQGILIKAESLLDNKIIKSYVFLAIELKGIAPNKTDLCLITRTLNKLFPMPVCILFKYEGLITLAIINRRRNLREGTRDVLTRVSLIRDISILQPHRAHIDILEKFSIKSISRESGKVSSFSELDDAWQIILSIQALNQRFYKDLVSWFKWASSEVKLARLPDYMEDNPDNRRRTIQEFLIRLVCRTLFAWFLKEKGLIDEKLLVLYDIADRPNILVKNDKRDAFLESSAYYRGILQNVFFRALNRPVDKRRKSGDESKYDKSVSDKELKKLAYLGKKYLPDDFDYGLFDKIPYLNGGLFDELPEDNVSDTIDDGVLNMPNRLFYARKEDGYYIEENESHRRPTRKSVEGLNRIFDHYRFTVAENTPLEEDLALDPELLGLVFENLLAEIDPNIEESEKKSIRKESGSFYTPRRIVDYMVNEALFLHVKTAFEKRKASQQELEILAGLFYKTAPEGSNFSLIADEIVSEFDKLRVLDPACGSGAFPMGMLHRMVEILRVIDRGNERWKKKILNRLPKEMQKDADRGMKGKSYDYLRKLGIIQNNLYGLDIQPLAVMIAKLRFFLTLVIEQEPDFKKPENNFNLVPLPNLETNIICCDTLKDVEIGDLLSSSIVSDLKTAREEYFNHATTPERREELAKKIGGDLASMFPGFAETVKGIKPPDVDKSKGVTKEDQEKMRSQQDAYWLTEWFKHASIPAPFFSVSAFFPELLDSPKATMTEKFSFVNELEGQQEFTETPRLHEGPFNIVIGNPPYGGTKISDAIKEALGLGSKDPYGAFIARFLNNESAVRPCTPLAPDGILSYIVSDTFMTIKSHRPLREQLIKHRVHKMLRVHPDTFRATVNCTVIICQRGEADQRHICQMADLTNVSIHEEFERFLHILYKTEGFASRQNISNQTYAIYHYPQKLIETNSNIPFFVASPKLFALLNDTTAATINEKIDGKSVPARKIEINRASMRITKLRNIADAKDGMTTGDNDYYLYQEKDARGNYKSIEKLEDKIFNEDDLSLLTKNEEYRKKIIEIGFSKTNDGGIYKSGKYIVPYDKGGESDSEDGWLPNYFVKTAYYIDWSKEAVKRLNTLTIAERIKLYNEPKKILDHYHKVKASVIRNSDCYFLQGLTFSRTGMYSPTFRLMSGAVFDSKSNFLKCEIDPIILLAFLNSKFIKFIFKNYLGHTVQSEGDSIESIPIIMIVSDLNEKLRTLTSKIIQKQKTDPRYDYASNEQLEIDRLIYEAYGLNDDDIKEVESWYSRRYPKLAAAQRRTLAAKLGKTEEQIIERQHWNLYCDESRHLPFDREPIMLLGLLEAPSEKVHDLHKELAEIWEKHKLPGNFECKWTKVSSGKEEYYLDILKWFFNKSGLSFRVLILPDKQDICQKLPEQCRDDLYYRLYYQLLSGEIDEDDRYRIFIDIKDTRGREKVRHLKDVLRKDAGDLIGQTIRDVQITRSHEVRLMQVNDLLLGAVGYARKGLKSSSAKCGLVREFEKMLGHSIKADTPPGIEKVTIITCHDGDALLI